MRKLLTCVAAGVALAACSHLPPESTPELFGQGTISTPENELNAAFSPDGRTLYFTRAAGANGRLGVIVVSRALGDGRWSDPEAAEFSGHYSDYDPMVSPDGARLFFISKRPPRDDFDIWVVERSGKAWGEPRNLGSPVNTEGDELYPSVASDGTLYFSSCGRADSRGRCDLYRSRFRDGQYLEPENLGEPVNTPASETDAFVAPDQSYLIFAAYGRADAVGDGDLYVSHFRDGAWSAPRSLGPQINTAAREYCPIVSPDGTYFYFTRQSDGVGNVYRIPISAILRPAQ